MDAQMLALIQSLHAEFKHNLPVAPNLLDHNFMPEAPNQIWTSGIIHFWTDKGWLYLMKQLV